MEFLSLFSCGGSSGGATISSRIQETEEQSHSNLIQILSIATALGVNIIPLTWRPALEGLGEGATGRVSQSPMNSQISLAFKRLSCWDRSQGQSETQFRALQHKALGSEMVALNCLELHDHENIVNLEGLCWELSDESLSPEVWPVLVFKKAEYGDLRRFLSLPEAEHLELRGRIEICRKIAKALEIMHQCGIVHGDIKPENVLVGKGSEPSNFDVKMTDFGYSCYGSTDDDFVKLPRSQPWEAPEYHPRWFTLAAAKKTDMYSFGLLCLWLLFPGEVLTTQLGEINLALAFGGNKGQPQAHLETLKQKGSILDFVLELLSRHPGLDKDICSRLRSVFNLSLHLNPAERASTMRRFVELLCMGDVPQDPNPLKVVNIASTPSWHGNLELEKFCFQVEACDFRVQAYIARQLLITAERMECRPCASNAAFQLALCYSFGFGVRAELDKCQYWLKRSKRNDVDLEQALNSIQTMDPPVEALPRLIGWGYQSQLAEFYVDQGIVAEAVAEYRAMILSREQVFGSTHFSPSRMRSLLGDIFQRDHQLKEAAEVRTKEIEIALLIPDFSQIDILVLKSKLARTLEDMGEFEKSEALRLEVLEGYSKLPSGGVGRVIALFDLSSISLAQGKYSSAVERGIVAVDESVKVLGQDHANTLIARSTLATAYFRLGEVQKAIDQNEEVLRFRKQGLGLEHRDTIETLSRLAFQYHNLSQWPKAKDAFGQVWKARKKSDGENSRSALLAGHHYASTIVKLGEIKEAYCIQEKLLVEMTRIFGEENQSTIEVMAGLGVTYSHLRLWEEAEDLGKKVLAYRKQKLGPHHALTLQAMRNLADIFFNEKKWTEAAELGLEEMEIRQSTARKPDVAMIEAATGCARSLAYLERWAEAGPVLDLEISMRTEMDSDEVETFEAIVLATTGYMKTGEWPKARQRIATLFERSLQLRHGRKSMVGKIDALATSCQLNKWLEEAEQLFVLEFLLRKTCCPEDKQGFEELEEKIIQVMQMQEKSGHSVEFDPRNIISRAKREQTNSS